MAKIKGFSLLEKCSYAQLRNYLDFWAGVVTMEVRPFMEAHQWLDHVVELKEELEILPPVFDKLPTPPPPTEFEEALQQRGYLVLWEFDPQHIEAVINHWVLYKEISASDPRFPVNGDGVE